jgi:serine protease Do
MSFAIPVEDIVPFLDGLAKSGRVRHGMLGVSTRSVFVNGAGGPSDRVPIGALVEGVAPNGPAARLGLRKGDLIVAFDGEKVEYSEQLARWVAVAGPGVDVKLVWVRDELGREGRVRLDEAPSAIPSWMRVEAPTAANTNATSAPNAPTAVEVRPGRSARAARDSAR